MKTLATIALTLTLATVPAIASAQIESDSGKKKVNTSLRVIMEQHKTSDTKATNVSMERRALLNRQLPHRPNQA